MNVLVCVFDCTFLFSRLMRFRSRSVKRLKTSDKSEGLKFWAPLRPVPPLPLPLLLPLPLPLSLRRLPDGMGDGAGEVMGSRLRGCFMAIVGHPAGVVSLGLGAGGVVVGPGGVD